MDITVVLVTFNRISELKKTLIYYSEQTFLPKSIIVVNNASTDGTKEFLDNWSKIEESFVKIVINSSINLGGAGGFALGMEKAMETCCDFIFISDDDAFPEINMFEILLQTASSIDNNKIAAYCTSVVNNGKKDLMHRRRVYKKFGFVIKDIPVNEREYKEAYFDLDYLTFVGSLIKTEVIKEIGFPRTDYFIREDDAEYSLRIRKIGKIVCVTKSVMKHNTGYKSKLWLDYYTIRNNLHNTREFFGKSYYIYAKSIWYFKRCSLLAKIIKGRSYAYRMMCKQAIEDADNGIYGFNNKYSTVTKLQ